MFGKRITLFNLFGFEVKIDISWLIIAALITWSLATGIFPNFYEELSNKTYWVMGVIGTLGLFISIVLHELSHSLVARKFGLPIKGITLFIFGGIAEMEDEPPSPKAEFFMGIAGPLMSIALGFLFLGIYLWGQNYGINKVFTGIFGYLRWINFVLAGFNLLPAFPLDGGRIFRSALWQWKDDIRWATRIASAIGSGFGILLILLGIFLFIRGSFIVGIWWALIGLFMRNASRMSYRRVLIREYLEGDKVRRFMKENPVTVSPSTTIQELVEDYIYKHHFKMFPVVENEKPVGCVTTRKVKEIPREEWENNTVKNVYIECSGENTISPEDDAMKALSKMNSTGNSRLMVIDENKLVGIITLKDMLSFLSFNLDI